METVLTRDKSITSTADAASKLSDLITVGNPDDWLILSNAASKAGGFLHATKAMNVPGGVIVDIYSETRAGATRSSVFVPGVEVVADRRVPGVNRGHIISSVTKPYDPADFVG